MPIFSILLPTNSAWKGIQKFARMSHKESEPEMCLMSIVSCTKHVLAELYHLSPPLPPASPPICSLLNDCTCCSPFNLNPSTPSRNDSIEEVLAFLPLGSIQFPFKIPGRPQQLPSPPLPFHPPISSMVILNFPWEWMSMQLVGAVSLPSIAQIVLPDNANDDSMQVDYGDLILLQCDSRHLPPAVRNCHPCWILAWATSTFESWTTGWASGITSHL